jgi:hypothetical protein
MSRGNTGSFREVFKDVAGELVVIESLDLITLRGHSLVELALKDLLALRLGVAIDTLPDLTFARLVTLSTAAMPVDLRELLLHVNRIRNYVAHHVHAKELDSKVANFFRDQKQFGVDSYAVESVDKKRFVWGVALGMLATIVGTLSTVLTQFRKSQRDCDARILGADEPTMLAEIGKAAVRDLSVRSWLEVDFAPD